MKSEVKWTIDLDFNSTNVEDFAVYDDFAFIERADMNLFVLASSNEHKVAIVDLSGSSPTTSYVTFKDGPVEGRLRTRQVEWAEGTHYVWVSDREQNEVYVVDIVDKKLVNTLAVDEARKFLSVVNHAFYAMADRLDRHWGENGASSSAVQALSQGVSNQTQSTLSIVAIFLSSVAIVAVAANMLMMMKKNNEETATKTKDDPSLVMPSVN